MRFQKYLAQFHPNSVVRLLRRWCRTNLVWWLDRLLLAAASSPRSWIRRAAVQPLSEIRRLPKLLSDGFTVEVVLLRGIAAIGQSQLAVAYIGSGSSLDYLQHILFADRESQRERIERCRVWDLRKTVLAIEDRCDMAIIERNSLLKWKPTSGRWVAGPPWVRMVYDFTPGETWEQMRKRFRGQKQNMRRIARSGYTYRICHSSSDFDYFYRRMYLPYVTDRHHGYAIISDERYLETLFRDGRLLFVLRGGTKPVAASLSLVYGDACYGIVTGVLDGDRKWVKDGALSALYYFEMMWCHDNGMRRMDVGRCRPFINDGLFGHKTLWGFRPILDPWSEREWTFWVPNHYQPAHDWLSVHSYIPSIGQSHEDPMEMAVS